jgi:aminopeptidase N
MGNFRQGIILIHELRQLAGTEEFLDGRRHRLGIDQFLWHQTFGLRHTETLLHGALNTHQADTEYVFSHLTDTTDTPVTQVVDIVDNPVAVADIHQRGHDIKDV